MSSGTSVGITSVGRSAPMATASSARRVASSLSGVRVPKNLTWLDHEIDGVGAWGVGRG